MTDELKPCPFCGGDAAISGNGMYVYCKDCGCKSPYVTTGPRFVIAAWNRRAQPAAPADAEPSVAPEPVAWMWRNTRTGAKGVYFEDPGKFFNIAAKDEYEWTPLFAPPDTENRRAQPAAHADAEPSVAPEPVAWLSVDCIGERYLCFSKPMDNDTVTPLFAHPPRAPLTEEQKRDLVKECDLDWQRGFMPLFDDDPTNRYAVLIEAVEAAHGIGGK